MTVATIGVAMITTADDAHIRGGSKKVTVEKFAHWYTYVQQLNH